MGVALGAPAATWSAPELVPEPEGTDPMRGVSPRCSAEAPGGAAGDGAGRAPLSFWALNNMTPAAATTSAAAQTIPRVFRGALLAARSAPASPSSVASMERTARNPEPVVICAS